ncbi:MAG: S8 family serine peptidase [Candidatus Sericytochromatia bacterium]|nr:S8 family serine peptidase [Candidatus Tanganyikabacteria bacterium]
MAPLPGERPRSPARALGAALARWAGAAALALSACFNPGPAPTGASDFVPGQVIVGYRPASDRAALRDEFGVLRAVPLGESSELWVLPAGHDPLAVSRRVRGVRFSQPNYVRRIQAYQASEFDPAVPAKDNPLWHLAVVQANQAWGVDRPATLRTFAADNPPGKPIMVAVVDSGVDVRHPDLAANIARDASGSVRYFDEISVCGSPPTDELAPPGASRLNFNYATAYSDAAHPGPDGNGHGTHVAGIIAALGNNQPGVECKEPPCNTVGLGPGVSILPVKTMNALGDGNDFCIARGLRDAADAGARVINLSVGGPQPGPALEEAIEYLAARGALLVVASGNDGLRVNYPAAYPGAIAVGAVGHPADAGYPEALSKGAQYSSSGPELDLVAPGGSDTADCPERKCGVYSTVPTYTSDIVIVGKVVGTGYGRLTGTSMATPQVSAVAALILSREPNLSAAQVRQRLVATAVAVPGTGGAFTDRFGYGLLNPLGALSQVSHDGK